MSNIELMENVTVTYDGRSRIAVKGKQVKIVLTINSSELMNVYSGNDGKARVLVSIDTTKDDT